MRCVRPAIAADPFLFGRRRDDLEVQERVPLVGSDDVRLFLTTFAAGFVFVAALIA